MAIRIDIPGIGPVEVEGVASEETLQKIAATLAKSSGSLAKDQENQSKALKKSTKEITDHSTGWVAAADNLTQSMKNLALTATSVATKFFANYDQIAASPIKAGQALLNTAIDITANFVGGLAGSVPVIGGFLKGVTDATAALAKMANDAFADQLQKNIDALQIYAKSGISFSGGMTAMQNAAQSAGLGIKDFAQGVSKAKHDLDYLGMSGGDAVDRLGGSLGATVKIIGKSGQNLRNEMLALGYSYDDQIEIMASFMANMKTAGKLEKMSKEEIALATRDYARDLKVLADFTGQDAKKLMDRARQQELMVAVQQELSKQEQEGVGNATAALARMGPDADRARQALTQMMLRGATNVIGYTQGPGREMIESMVKDIKAGNTDLRSMNLSVGRAMFKAQEQMAKDPMQSAINVAKTFDAAGVAIDGNTQMQIGLFSKGKLTADAVEKMGEQADKQSTATDDLTKGMQTAYQAGQDFKVAVEAFINSKLDVYARTLGETFKSVTDQLKKFLNGKNQGDYTPPPGSKPTDLTGLPGDKRTIAQKLKDDADVRAGRKAYNALGFDQPNIDPYEKHDKGGKIGAGDIGIAGERGPELISGPSSVLSRVSTEKLIVALDAMRESKGTRFSDNDFEWMVNMTPARLAKIKERMSGFEGFDTKALEAELDRRPEMDAMKKAKEAMMVDEDKPTVWPGKEAADQTNALLSELVNHMRQNVAQTAKVAMNTN